MRAIHDRIGGEPKLRAILRDFYQRQSSDVMLMHYFIGKDLDDIAEKQLAFLLKVMGVVREYSHRAPPKAHDAIPPIWRGQFDRRLRVLEDTLRAHGLSQEDIRTWVDFENSFRDAIVIDEPH